MARKRLVVFYHFGPGNENISTTDYDQFYQEVKTAASAANIKDFVIEPVDCVSVNKLFDKIELLTSPSENIDELYFHFSGHGGVTGIPYDDWILKNEDLAALLCDSKIKFCFFSSCRSSELVKLANLNQVPVVIGTLGENDIANNYAISFQTHFYKALIKSQTFNESFNYAVARMSNNHQVAVDHNCFVRGEGGEEMKMDQVNALQMACLTEKDKARRMLPANFLLKMENLEQSKPVCLNWFDDNLQAFDFEERFFKKGFDEQLTDIRIPSEELPLLNNRGINDPFLSCERLILIIHCTKSPLPPEIKDHLRAQTSNLTAKQNPVEKDHYQILFATSNTITKKELLENDKLESALPDEKIFKFDVNASELLLDNEFIKRLDQQNVSFDARKKATLGFNTRPNKREIVTLNDTKKYVRMFFGSLDNERLINFLINWFRDLQSLTCPVIVLDNIGNLEMDIASELSKLLTKYTPETELKHQFYKLYKDGGAIIVIRNRSDKDETFVDTLNSLITSLDESSKFLGGQSIATTLLFILQDKSVVSDNEEKEFISQKNLSNPDPVDNDMISTWQEDHNSLKASAIIAQAVKDISKKINPNDFKNCCPSAVIELICEEFKIPSKPIIGI